MTDKNKIEFSQCGFTVTDENITKLEVDCIVNAANKTLLGGGVDGTIHRATGPEQLAECRGLGGCRTGEAKLTKGYRLPAKYVIHTVDPIYGVDDNALLERCYWNCMELAKASDIHSIAFRLFPPGYTVFLKRKPRISPSKPCYAGKKATYSIPSTSPCPVSTARLGNALMIFFTMKKCIVREMLPWTGKKHCHRHRNSNRWQ